MLMRQKCNGTGGDLYCPLIVDLTYHQKPVYLYSDTHTYQRLGILPKYTLPMIPLTIQELNTQL